MASTAAGSDDPEQVLFHARTSMKRWLLLTVLLVLVAALALFVLSYARRHPENVPWTELDLTQPVGTFTLGKLVALRDDSQRCRALLTSAGVRFTPAPDRRDGAQCGYAGAVRPQTGRASVIAYRPADVAVSCPIAASLALWEWHVVQPAAERHFGTTVNSIEHFGSYSCRRLYGRSQGSWSEHATANAFDIAAFRLADGRRVSVVRDWAAGNSSSAFLHEVRDGACRMFATVLSPDYNAAHRDHLHLDLAARGRMNMGLCT